jgi:hypothetical protein
MIKVLVATGLLLAATGTVEAQEYPPLSVGAIGKASVDWRDGFLVGVFQGTPGTCPRFVSGRTMIDLFDATIRSGRARPEMPAVVVMQQLMRESGCVLDGAAIARPNT